MNDIFRKRLDQSYRDAGSVLEDRGGPVSPDLHGKMALALFNARTQYLLILAQQGETDLPEFGDDPGIT